MARGFPLVFAALLIAANASAQAAEVTIRIADETGNPAANAVVVFVTDGTVNSPDANDFLDTEREIDQRDETFLPLVTILPEGGAVRFANSDAPLHQVYSFSPIKQFELTLAPGETSDAVMFDEGGVAAIGCNIHDHMIAYVFVTKSPWTALTDEDGRAVLENVPAGNYVAEVWHPRLPPATPTPHSNVTVSEDGTAYEASISLLPDRSTHRTHGGRY
jgi:plastocyanin